MYVTLYFENTPCGDKEAYLFHTQLWERLQKGEIESVELSTQRRTGDIALKVTAEYEVLQELIAKHGEIKPGQMMGRRHNCSKDLFHRINEEAEPVS